MPLNTGQVLNNRYRIDMLLAEGSFGSVYRALDLTLNTQVALKECLNNSPEAVQQFELEARLLANLRHENLAYVIDHFSLSGQGQYLVMEFVEGQDLQTLINQARNGLPEMQVLPWIERVCDALIFLHSQSPPLYHRDIKPANIKINPKGQVELVDYGIAKTSDASRSATAKIGAPGNSYTPPEQYAGFADGRSDIYSLGATLYTTLTGKAPLDCRQRQSGKALIPARQLNPAITPQTEAAIMRAMELDIDRRFQNVEEMKTALGMPLPATFTGGLAEYVPVTSDAPPERSRNWVIWGVAAIAVLCLVGVILAGAGAYLYFFLPVPTTPSQISQDLSGTSTALATLLMGPGSPTVEASIQTTSPAQPATATATFTTQPPSETPPQPNTPTLTPSPSLTVTGDPKATWQPCAGIYPSRLHVGDQASVSLQPPLPNRVRTQPNTNGVVVGFLQPGEKMEILEGPICSDTWIWWRVRSLSSGMTGWTAEGDENNYWLVPVE